MGQTVPQTNGWIHGSLTGTLTIVSGLHIADPMRPRGTLRLTHFVRDHAGRPFIPGSTLKGALRTQVAIAIRTVGDLNSSSLWACDFPDSVDRPELSFCQREGPSSDPCTVCALFGSSLRPSRVWVKDSHLLGDWGQPLMQTRSTIALARATRAALRGSTRRLEVLPPGLQFEFMISLLDPAEYELGLIFYAIEQLNQGIGRMGGAKRLGLGQVALSVDRAELRRVGPGLETQLTICLPKAQMPKPQELPKQQKMLAELGIPKPSTDDIALVISYCLKLLELREVQPDSGEIGKLLAAEFGLDRKKRKELGLPEKVSEILDALVAEGKLTKDYLGHYALSPEYVPQFEAGPEVDLKKPKPPARLTIEELRKKCLETLHLKLFPNQNGSQYAQ